MKPAEDDDTAAFEQEMVRRMKALGMQKKEVIVSSEAEMAERMKKIGMGKKEKIMLSEEELASRLQKLQGSSSTKKISEAELTVKVSRLTNQEFSIPSASARNCGRRSSSDELAELLGQITDEMKLEAADDMSGTTAPDRVEEEKTNTTANAKRPIVVLAKEMQKKASGLSEIEQFMLAVQDEELSDTCSENDDEDNEEDHILGKQGKKNNKKEKNKTAGTHASDSYNASQVQALLREAQKVEGSVVQSKLDVSEKEVAALLKSLDL